jgi:hypothetical protein
MGNDAINYALRHLLKEAFGSQVNLIQVPAIELDGQGWHSGLGARTVHEMNLYGHAVVVGGGNLYENGQLDVDKHAVAQLRPPLLLCGLSHGRIYDHRHSLTTRTDAMPDDVIVALNGAARASLVRDRATLEHLQGLGLRSVELAACPTLLLGKILAQDPPPSKSGTLISIRNPELMSIPLTDQARVRGELEQIIKVTHSQGLGPVRLLCHDKRDMAFAASLGNVEYILPDDVETYFDLLRGAELVVSFRLHAFLPCLSLGTPTINISYDERSLSLVRTIGMGDWDIDLVKEPDVASLVMDRIDRIDELSTLLGAARKVWAPLEEKLLSALRDLVNEAYAYAAENTVSR